MPDDVQHQELMRRLRVPERLTVSPPPGTPSPTSSGGGGELPGVRATMNKMIADGEDPAQMRSVAANFDRLVREGKEPPPKRR